MGRTDRGGSGASGCCSAARQLCARCDVQLMRLWRLRPALVHRLARSGVDRGTADDLAAEALTVAWRKLGDVPTEPVQAERWLGAVARNLLRNHRRHAVRREGRLRLLHAGLRSAGAEPSPSLDRLAGVAAWQVLSDGDREVLALAGGHGLGPDDLAAHLRCSPAAAKKRLSRARLRLLALLSV